MSIIEMKILHIILSEALSGSEKYVIDLANFQSKKHNVLIVNLRSPFDLEIKKSLRSNIKLLTINSFFKSFAIKKIIKKENPEIVHTHLGEAAKIIKKKWGNFKLITTMHMNYKHKYFKKFDAIICSNNTQKKEIQKKFKGQIFRLNLWPINSKKEKKFSKKLNTSKKKFIFGSIGRFHKQKGFELLADTFDKYKIPNTILILIGDGYEKYKKKYIHNKSIKIMGYKKNTNYYYNKFDTFVITSVWESFGITLLEAMKNRLPIITTVHEGNKDWIKKFNLTKIKINNEKDLKNALVKHSTAKKRRIRYNLTEFSYGNICNKILVIYQKIIT